MSGQDKLHQCFPHPDDASLHDTSNDTHGPTTLHIQPYNTPTHTQALRYTTVVVVFVFVMFGWGKKKAQALEKPVVEEAPKVPRLDLSQVIAETREEEEDQRRAGGFEREDEKSVRRKCLLLHPAGRALVLPFCTLKMTNCVAHPALGRDGGRKRGRMPRLSC